MKRNENMPMNPPPPTTAADRVISIDALRGFDMYWIMGGKPLLVALAAAMIHANGRPEWLKRQLEHTHWVGFTCYDLIMPLFMFIVGAAMPFAFGFGSCGSCSGSCIAKSCSGVCEWRSPAA